MAGETRAEAAWFYSQGGQQSGPVGLGALRGLASSGGLRPADLVWTHGMAQWTAAGEVPSLAPSFAPASPGQPPPLPPPGAYAPAQGTPYPPGGMPLSYQGAPMHGHPGGPQAPGLGDDAGMRWLIPVGRSGWAIAAGYLGLFSFMVLPAPIALVISLIAIRDIRSHPNRHGMGRAIFGLVMGILGTALLTFIAIARVAGR